MGLEPAPGRRRATILPVDLAASDPRPSLFRYAMPELVAQLAELGQPAWRARQVWRWLYVGLVEDFAQMTDLPAGLRADLAQRFCLHTLTLETATDSHDSPATKYLFRMADGSFIETVLMHYGDEAAGWPARRSRPAAGHGRA